MVGLAVGWCKLVTKLLTIPRSVQNTVDSNGFSLLSKNDVL